MKSLETQIAGQHYKNQKIQPIEYILENELPFIEGNIVKYITRGREKRRHRGPEESKALC